MPMYIPVRMVTSECSQLDNQYTSLNYCIGPMPWQNDLFMSQLPHGVMSCNSGMEPYDLTQNMCWIYNADGQLVLLPQPAILCPPNTLIPGHENVSFSTNTPYASPSTQLFNEHEIRALYATGKLNVGDNFHILSGRELEKLNSDSVVRPNQVGCDELSTWMTNHRSVLAPAHERPIYRTAPFPYGNTFTHSHHAVSQRSCDNSNFNNNNSSGNNAAVKSEMFPEKMKEQKPINNETVFHSRRNVTDRRGCSPGVGSRKHSNSTHLRTLSDDVGRSVRQKKVDLKMFCRLFNLGSMIL